METHPDPIPTAAEPDRLEAVALEIAAKMVAALTRLAGNGLALARRGMQDLPFLEDLLRRVIYLMALRLDAPAPAPAAIPKRPAASAPSAEMEREPRAPRFRLIEPEQDRDPRRLLTPAECPRATLMDDTAQPFIPPIQAAPKPPRPRPGFEDRYLRRTQALADALANLDTYAMRMAHWMARQASNGAKRLSPLAAAPAPEHAEIAKTEPAVPVLSDLYLLVLMALGSDTS
ncbi:hypothetical protein [uncultured Hyphomonas sp.]|uniref:hypothetical protein n=1 Tax=uncultured Hyphomonas sp. TaxID=225298 RepID=UPI0030DA2EE6|tara:strand:- start:679 stop:1371 length:693 start_codon:yes stop_codon:yes gene_type:complete